MAMLQKSRVLKIYKARLQFFPLGGLCKSFLRFELECRYTNVFQLATRSPLSDHSNIMSCCQSLQASFCHQIIPKQCKTISIIIATTWYFPNIILLLTFKFVDVSPYNSPPHKTTTLKASWSPLGDETKHIAQLRSYASSTCRRGAQVFRLGTSESTKGWEWITWSGWEAWGTDIFSPFQLMANNRRGSNLWESLRFFFVILFRMLESGMPTPSQNAWDI